MRLNRRDGVATALAALAVAYYFAHLRGSDTGALSNVRGVTAGVFLLGMTAGVVGGDLFRIGDSRSMDRGLLAGSVLGTVAMLAATGAMLTGSGILLALLVADTALLWAVATVRHLALPRPADHPAPWSQPAHERILERVNR